MNKPKMYFKERNQWFHLFFSLNGAGLFTKKIHHLYQNFHLFELREGVSNKKIHICSEHVHKVLSPSLKNRSLLHFMGIVNKNFGSLILQPLPLTPHPSLCLSGLCSLFLHVFLSLLQKYYMDGQIQFM